MSEPIRVGKRQARPGVGVLLLLGSLLSLLTGGRDPGNLPVIGMLVLFAGIVGVHLGATLLKFGFQFSPTDGILPVLVEAFEAAVKFRLLPGG
jgi:hypothetical protein